MSWLETNSYSIKYERNNCLIEVYRAPIAQIPRNLASRANWHNRTNQNAGNAITEVENSTNTSVNMQCFQVG